MSRFGLTEKMPALLLAPMEGVTDSPMRALLTESTGFTHTVTEFLRISHQVPPRKVYRWHLPELARGARTPSGIPINFQLLGGNPELMAQAAAQAATLGPMGIDLNFGCPAPTVNRHDGGATILQSPQRVEAIVRAVRDTLPASVPLSVKIRLGWHDLGLLYRNVEAAVRGGADSLAIHGRTKAQGYAPPALWEPIRLIRKMITIPVVANGDIWSLEDFKRCRDVTECCHFMLGRSALANPFLACSVARDLGLASSDVPEVPTHEHWRSLIQRFFWLSEPLAETSAYSIKRTKQWLKYAYLRGLFPEFEKIKTCGSTEEIRKLLGLGASTVSPHWPREGASRASSSVLLTRQALKTTTNPAHPVEFRSTQSLR